jgi:hypothetical protein
MWFGLYDPLYNTFMFCDSDAKSLGSLSENPFAPSEERVWSPVSGGPCRMEFFSRIFSSPIFDLLAKYRPTRGSDSPVVAA